MYRIDSAADRANAPKMSAYPKQIRPFTEPVSATEDREFPKGLSLPEMARQFYKGCVPTAFTARFGFLDRDNKVRDYDPGETDPFVFKNNGSLKKFSQSAYQLMAHLVEHWKELGLPVKHDEDRKCDVPDGHAAIEALAPNHPLHKIIQTNRNAVYFILANADIVKKACVVRTINYGWWVVSYAGKSSPNRSYFSVSLRAHKRAVRTIMNSQAGKQKYYELWAENGDPLLTNPGYPFYAAQIDADGNPVARIKTVELFRGLQKRQFSKWNDLLEEVDRRAGAYGLRGYPFAVAPLRRLQPGYKFAHQFELSGSGLLTAFDERGPNSQRVAHMVPYVYNVITSPVSTLYKSVRYFLPGCYHDGPAKTKRTARLREMGDKKELWLMEADYSNFDRFMPVDLIEEIVSWFTDATQQPSYWYDAMVYLHEDASLIWPDYTIAGSGRGWVFKPGKLGLLSGVKATSETGTLVNSVVNGEALARAYGWNEDQLYAYLTQYVDSPVGSKYEYFYVQSDDTQLIATDPKNLSRHGKEFEAAVKAAGLKGSVELADRFLMRHIQDGGDRPVPARVWQNTLSNESPVDDELIFLAGLASRTDGLLGVKTVDAFGTGKLREISPIEASFTKLVLDQLYEFVSTSRRPSSTGKSLLQLLIEEAKTYNSQRRKVAGVSIAKLDSLRHAITATLAKRESEKLVGGRVEDSWLYQLHRDRQSPASAALIDELIALSSEVAPALKKVEAKESAFFKYSCEALGVRPMQL